MPDKELAQELLDKIKECMSDLDDIFRSADHLTRERWRSYPKGNIAMSLDDDHGYMGSGTFTIQALIDDLPDDSDSDEDDEE
jgi:hypothetical protein